jgi:hypothetical protein
MRYNTKKKNTFPPLTLTNWAEVSYCLITELHILFGLVYKCMYGNWKVKKGRGTYRHNDVC